MKNFIIGTRNSNLSIIQTKDSLNKISSKLPMLSFEIKPMSSAGDLDQKTDLRKSPTDFFTDFLDKALLTNKIDAAVHSAKDIGYPTDKNIDWFWLPWKEDHRDAIVLRKKEELSDLPNNFKIGLSSERREIYCKKTYPHAQQLSIRGTIERRLEQLDNKDYDMVIIAVAALNRLGLQDRIYSIIDDDDLSSPEGQGSIAITFNKGDNTWQKIRQMFIKPVVFAGGGIGMQSTSLAVINALKIADICLVDDLLDLNILNYCSKNCKIISVGKRSGAHKYNQDEITNLICDYARQGKRVIRLKGGDPGIFGRLIEETEALTELGINFQVLPGVPALCTATTGTGFLLTQRAISRGFSVMTPSRTENPNILPEPITKEPLILFMAIAKIEQIKNELEKKGYPSTTPIAAVFNAGMADQFIINSNLAEIAVKIANKFGTYQAEVSPPGILIIGNFKNEQWANCGPLANKKIIFTGSQTLQETTRLAINDLGGNMICLPLIELSPNLNDKTIQEKLCNNNAVIISSPSAARCLVEVIKHQNIDIRTIPSIISCGPGTTKALNEHGLHPFIAPKENFSTEGMIEEIQLRIEAKTKILRLRNETAGEKMAQALVKLGFVVQEHLIYQNSPCNNIPEKIPDANFIFFASSSAVRCAIKQFGIETIKKYQILTIGEPTAQTLNEFGIIPDFVSPQNTVQDAIFYLASKITDI